MDHLKSIRSISRMTSGLLLISFVFLFVRCNQTPDTPSKPNVVFVITDDQGYGDLGCHGNEWISTPNIDQLAAESYRLTDFHVGTTCAPTRSGIMTGRNCNRVSVWHTVMGRSLLHRDEVTMAEIFKQNGYATGMFGKWHLGDNYPYRPHERGFDQTFYNGGGGVWQAPDYWGNDYFDDTYFRNGVPEKASGYCTDVWFENALSFIESNKEAPFFCYLSTNAPHSPYHVEQKYIDMYADNELIANPNFYGMITNIDENMGVLREKLEEWGLADNTILIWMTDNGTAAGADLDDKSFVAKGYNAGMRGKKGSPYNGGHRVPFFVHWKDGKLTGGKDINKITAYTDVLPTLIDLCGLESPEIAFDGTSLKPLFYKGETGWPERVITTDTQREDFLKKYKQFATMTEKWHLVGKELFDMENDPGQTRDVAELHPDVAEMLKAEYEKYWIGASQRADEYTELLIDTRKENPYCLRSHDWHTPELPPWNQPQIREGMVDNGWWMIDFAEAGTYEFAMRRWPLEAGAALDASVPKGDEVPGGTAYKVGTVIHFVNARIKLGDEEQEKIVSPGDMDASFRFDVVPGKIHLQTWMTDDKGIVRGAYYVYVTKVIP